MSNDEKQLIEVKIDPAEGVKHIQNIVEASKYFGNMDRNLGKHLLGIGSQLTDFMINVDDVFSRQVWAKARTQAAEEKYGDEIDDFANELLEGID